MSFYVGLGIAIVGVCVAVIGAVILVMSLAAGPDVPHGGMTVHVEQATVESEHHFSVVVWHMSDGTTCYSAGSAGGWIGLGCK